MFPLSTPFLQAEDKKGRALCAAQGASGIGIVVPGVLVPGLQKGLAQEGQDPQARDPQANSFTEPSAGVSVRTFPYRPRS